MIELIKKEIDDKVVIDVRGRIVYETEEEFRSTIEELLENEKFRIILNLKELVYINSSGLGVMINLLKKAQKLGGDIKLVEIPEEIRELFTITSLDQVFDIFESEDVALQSF